MDYLKVNISMHFDLRKTAADPGYENLTKPHIQIGPCGYLVFIVDICNLGSVANRC
jgi:hypothetical protein